MVKFSGEEGVDFGGPRMTLLSILYDSIETTIDAVDAEYQMTKDLQNDAELHKEIGARLFAFGVWCGKIKTIIF